MVNVGDFLLKRFQAASGNPKAAAAASSIHWQVVLESTRKRKDVESCLWHRLAPPYARWHRLTLALAMPTKHARSGNVCPCLETRDEDDEGKYNAAKKM